TGSAIGVGIFSARDLLAAARSDRLDRGDPAVLVAGLKPRQSILVTGGTGFIGTRLVESLVAARHHVTVLTRDPRKADELAHPVRVISSLDMIDERDHFDAVVNLAGGAVAGGIWTKKKRTKIIASRVDMTRAINALIGRLAHKPACLVNGSAVGWYGLQDDGDDAELSETAAAKPAFIHDVCDAWEQETVPVNAQGVRVVILRIGLVLGVDGGMLAKLLTPFEFGGGGIMGHGRQWMPWIEHDDLIRVIAFAIITDNLSGPINAVAPNPVRNDTFSRDLAGALHRPLLFRFPNWLLSGALGDLGRETMLGGQRVVPSRLIDSGFVFRHELLAPTLRKITGAKNAHSGA
ncbi:MAG: TIGR01777 family oxidoreductase, partial [Yoonia sp.]|uniref:TIGR01777 family oxidoreductase n=1 Tax=Yoonia sp. TaxID=2212373 RepID=UPI003EF9E0B3